MADRRRVKHHGKPAGLAGTTSTSSRTARRAELESGVPVSTSKKPRSFVPARHAGRRARPSRARGGPARRPRTRHRTPGECWDARDIWRPAAGRGWRRRGRGGTWRLAPVSVPGAGPGRPPPAGQVGWPTSPEGHRARGGWFPGHMGRGSRTEGRRGIFGSLVGTVRSGLFGRGRGPADLPCGARTARERGLRTGQILAAPPAKGPPGWWRLPTGPWARRRAGVIRDFRAPC